MARDLINNPTDFERVLINGVYEWRDILHKRYVYDGDDRIDLLKLINFFIMLLKYVFIILQKIMWNIKKIDG